MSYQSGIEKAEDHVQSAESQSFCTLDADKGWNQVMKYLIESSLSP